MKRAIIILIYLVLQGCQKNSNIDKVTSFYTENYYESDVLRLPLIYPYELVSAAGVDGFIADGGGKFESDFKSSGNIDSILVFDSSILMYGNLSMHSERYVIIHKLKDVHFLNKMEYRLMHDSLRVKGDLLLVADVYKQWAETKKLPWIISY